MKYIKLFESFRRNIDTLSLVDVENYLYELVDLGFMKINSCSFVTDEHDPNFSIIDDRQKRGFNYNLYNDEEFIINPYHYMKYRNWLFDIRTTIKLDIDIPQPRNRVRGNLDISGYIKSLLKRYFSKIEKIYNVNIFCFINREDIYGDIIGKVSIYIQERPPIKYNESIKSESTLLIIDVQKSFSEYFNDLYLNKLKKYAMTFNNVYQLWDNHIDGKNVDKDYLYDPNEEAQINHEDLYDFPNQVDIIEKRYNYDVDVDFYKKILSKEVYNDIKSKESNLKKGQFFSTTEGTIIVYIGNNHKWFHVPKKLYDLFNEYKGKEITVVGGARGECLDDVVTAGESIGVKINVNYLYTYSASQSYF